MILLIYSLYNVFSYVFYYLNYICIIEDVVWDNVERDIGFIEE